MPRAKTIMASVAMNGWTRNRAAIVPDTAPHSPPSTSTNGTAAQAGQPQWMLAFAKHTATSARTLPTDRSMPPAMMTSVMPQARMPNTDACRSASRCVPSL